MHPVAIFVPAFLNAFRASTLQVSENYIQIQFITVAWHPISKIDTVPEPGSPVRRIRSNRDGRSDNQEVS